MIGRLAAGGILGAVAVAAAAPAAAQQSPLALAVPGVEEQALEDGGLVIAVDADDDDEDGRVDAEQPTGVPAHGLQTFRPKGTGPVRVDVEGPLRVIHDGKPLSLPATIRPADTDGLALQGVRASSEAGDAALVVSHGGERRRIPVTVVGIALLDARNHRLDARTGALGLTHQIANDATLPRRPEWDGESPDAENVRIEIFDPRAKEGPIEATIETLDPETGAVRWSIDAVPLERPRDGVAFRSPWLRLVGDRVDTEAPGVAHRLLRVGLRDVVRVRYTTPAGTATQRLRLGRPGDEGGPRAARRATLRMRILNVAPGGPPAVGEDAESARRIGHEQVSIANEIWAQCFIGFGAPDEADVEVVDPPPPSLVAVADADGLPAVGGGVIRFRVDGRTVGPVQTTPGARPVATALAIAGAVEELGLEARVTQNAPTEFGAGRGADVLVRHADGSLATVSPVPGQEVGTDARQTVQIGRVDLSDGLQEFGNMNATAGTLEERALAKGLSDDDPSTIELFVVNHFTAGTRQGEAFIEGDAGAIVNAVLLDRNGLRQQRSAWTQSHEVGHVLLDQPYHPDNVGPDRPWLLMDADTSLPLVTGPKRISADQCHRVRSMSGVSATPALLDRLDPREQTPPPPNAPYDRGY